MPSSASFAVLAPLPEGGEKRLSPAVEYETAALPSGVLSGSSSGRPLWHKAVNIHRVSLNAH